MKEIIKQETIVKEIHTFVAEDGKTFNSENDCRYYEKTQNEEKLKRDYSRLVVGSPYFPYNDWSDSTFCCDIVKLKNLDDYYTLTDYMNHLTYGSWEDSAPTSFPCVKIVCSNEGYAGFSGWTVKELLERSKKAYDEMLTIAENCIIE